MAFSATLNKNGGSGGSDSFVYDVESEKTYSDLTLATEISSVSVPTRPGYSFDGYFADSGNQYVGSDGTLLEIVYSRAWTKNFTVTARWTRLSYVLTLDADGGTGGPDRLYYRISGGGWFTDEAMTNQVSSGTSIGQPRKYGYKSAGYYDFSSGEPTTRITSAQGLATNTLIDLTISEDTTFKANWYAVRKITLDDGKGSGGPGTIYYAGLNNVRFCTDIECDHPIAADGSLACVPEYKYRSFTGYYSASSGGTKYVNPDGSWASGLPPYPSEDVTWYAQYTRLSYRVYINGDGGNNAAIYASASGGTFYRDWKLTTSVSSLADIGLPTKECHSFAGAYAAAAKSGTKYIDSSGAFRSSLTSLTFTANITIYAGWSRRSYKITLDAEGGSGSETSVFADASTGSCSTLYADDRLESVIGSVTAPARHGYGYDGFWSVRGGTGVKYVSNYGNFTQALSALTLSGDLTIFAKWNPGNYLLTFDANGGTTPTPSKTVTTGVQIGELPTPTNPNGVFSSWKIGGESIGASTVWNHAGNRTAVAEWNYYFGNLTDWFGLSGNLLELVSSESGEQRRVTNLWNGACDFGNRLPNPVCTYRVKARGAVLITLGRAYVRGSGYLLSEVEYQTGSDQEPTLVVKGVANEGADAINLYPVTINVDPDHIAQDPFGAVSGGGELVEMKSAAVCDPVVVYENNSPCASDVVRGRLVVSGKTSAYFGEIKPTMNGDFVDSGLTSSESDVDFTVHSFTAERHI